MHMSPAQREHHSQALRGEARIEALSQNREYRPLRAQRLGEVRAHYLFKGPLFDEEAD
jgi:hypothetical protein